MSSLGLDQIQIRPVTAGDLDEVMRIANSSFKRPFSRQWCEKFLSPGGKRFGVVAGAGGEFKLIVGFMLYDQRKSELYLDYMAVCPGSRRRGVAARSIAWLKSQMAVHGASSIRLHAHEADSGPNRLYAKASFKEIGRAFNCYGDGYDGIELRFKPGA